MVGENWTRMAEDRAWRCAVGETYDISQTDDDDDVNDIYQSFGMHDG